MTTAHPAHDPIAERLAFVRERVREAARRSGRDPDRVRLVAVSKKKPSGDIREALAEGGQTAFGENYVQELLTKQDELAGLADRIEWHYIGHLQRNKVRQVVGRVALLHAVDSIRLLDEIEKRSASAGVTTPVLIQVNISREESKSGCGETEVGALVDHARGLAHVRLRGLMTMPPFFDEPEEARPYFRALRELRDRLVTSRPNDPDIAEALGDLSMGMSGDFEVAVEEGATLVRVGSLIFGTR